MCCMQESKKVSRMGCLVRCAPHEDGVVKASRRLIRKGCRSLLKMHTSRSTRLAWSGLLSTSGMRFRATCKNSVYSHCLQGLKKTTSLQV